MRKRKNLVQNNKILLIVENSEADFFNQYFKSYLQEHHQISIKCESSGRANKCEITNFQKMEKRINLALGEQSFKAVFLMLDLDTKCFKTESNHKCLIKLKQEYQPRYKINKELKNQFYLFIVCNEIESWFLTIDDNKKHTNNVHEDHKTELKKLLRVNSEPQIVQKMIKELKSNKFKLDFSKNSSLEYFVKKLKDYQ